MKTYRFFTKAHCDVYAETLEEAVKSFNEMKQRGLSPELDTVVRIEVQDEEGHFIPVDRALRGGDLDAGKEERLH